MVNAGFSVGDTEPGESKANKIYEPWRGSGVIMTVHANSLPQPNPSRVRYRGSSQWVTGLSLSEAEPGVYHNCSPSRTAHMCRISETAHVPVHSAGSPGMPWHATALQAGVIPVRLAGSLPIAASLVE